MFKVGRDDIDGVLVVLPNFGDEKCVTDTLKLPSLQVPILVQVYPEELKATSLQPVAEMASQAAIQADKWIKTGSTGKPEKQSIDMVLLTPENADQYEKFAPKPKE